MSGYAQVRNGSKPVLAKLRNYFRSTPQMQTSPGLLFQKPRFFVMNTKAT